MTDPILDTLLFLVRYRRAPADATAVFKRMKHNSDILPNLQTQLEFMLNAHGRFREVVYDTQGIHDDGVDAVVRIPLTESGGTPRLIGFQVKSYDDMNKPGYLKDLKAQHSDATRKVQGLDSYLIMLCTDMKRHRDRVRSVTSEFKSTANVEIIEPQFAYTFLQHPQTRIDAIVKRMVESSDFVFREALREVAAFENPSARALVVYLTVQSALHGQFEFYQDKLLTNLILERIYSELRERQAEQLQEYNEKKTLAAEDLVESDEDAEGVDGDFDEDEFEDEEEEPAQMLDFQDQLAADLDLIEAGVVSRDSSSGAFHLHADQVRAVSAVISDAIARFQYTRPELINYAFDVMGIRD
jgi:hypothetical protein